jgi:citrate lyase gamma subunit
LALVPPRKPAGTIAPHKQQHYAVKLKSAAHAEMGETLAQVVSRVVEAEAVRRDEAKDYLSPRD